MKQILLRSVTIKDFFSNYFYRSRFWFYRNFWKSKLSAESPRIRDGWELTFEDDFTKVTWGNSDNHEKWIVGQGWDPWVPKLMHYPCAPELVEGKSMIKLYAKYNPVMWPDAVGDLHPMSYEASQISTPMNFRQQYGRFECKCTIPHYKATWPAFWLWGSTWPPEIDVFEMWGGKNGERSAVQGADLHYDMHKDGTHGSPPKWFIKVEKENERNWHHFAVEWYPNKIEFFTDGVKIYQITVKEILKWFNENIAKMWIVLNHGVDGRYVGMDDKDYYSEYFADYVRAYKSVK